MNRFGDHAPDVKGHGGIYVNGQICGVFWKERHLSLVVMEALDGEFAIDYGDHDTAAYRRKGAIDDQEVVGINPGPNH